MMLHILSPRWVFGEEGYRRRLMKKVQEELMAVDEERREDIRKKAVREIRRWDLEVGEYPPGIALVSELFFF
jgi:hypothetical protein